MPPIAKKNDRIVGTDTHIVMVPTPAGQVPTPMPLPFAGPITDSLASSVFVDDVPVVVRGSEANNQPAHIAPGGQFMNTPKDKAQVVAASSSVFANDVPIARIGDAATSCDDMGAEQNAHIVSAGAHTCMAD
jgi:uncharacterized Zn-binding protein involved in type VI secretion